MPLSAEQLDYAASQYAAGTLGALERATFEQEMSRDPAAREAADAYAAIDAALRATRDVPAIDWEQFEASLAARLATARLPTAGGSLRLTDALSWAATHRPTALAAAAGLLLAAGVTFVALQGAGGDRSAVGGSDGKSGERAAASIDTGGGTAGGTEAGGNTGIDRFSDGVTRGIDGSVVASAGGDGSADPLSQSGRPGAVEPGAVGPGVGGQGFNQRASALDNPRTSFLNALGGTAPPVVIVTGPTAESSDGQAVSRITVGPSAEAARTAPSGLALRETLTPRRSRIVIAGATPAGAEASAAGRTRPSTSPATAPDLGSGLY